MLNKKTMAAVGLVLLVAFVAFGIRSCAEDPPAPDSKPTPTATTKAPPKSSTEYIVTRIKPRLDSLSGLDTKLKCPKTVELVKKNKLTCDVYGTPDGKGDPVARVTVTIRDKSGYFTWKSERLEPEKTEGPGPDEE